jgi:uncharacterized protein (TIGR03118 family)
MSITVSFPTLSRGIRSNCKRATYRPTLEVLEARAVPAGFRQTNLVADEPGVAVLHDPTLVNAWGISLNTAGGAFWVSANASGLSPLYAGDVNGSPLTRPFAVSIPGGAPTGQVFNASNDFIIQSGAASARSLFLFASESGIVSGWNPAVPPPPLSLQAHVGATRPDAVYTGLAIGNNGTANFLYAADMAGGRIDVFNGAFTLTNLAGNFTDPNLPDQFVPFNIQNLDGRLYVTYARQHPQGGVDRLQSGIVNVFDLNGQFLRRLVTATHLHAPWGLALAPATFGPLGGALLVGNHRDGTINAFDRDTGAFRGKLRNESGDPIRIDGLFGLAFGNGVSAGDSNALYFASGPRGGQDGLFGSLRFVPDAPASSLALFLAASGETNEHALPFVRLDFSSTDVRSSDQPTQADAQLGKAPQSSRSVEYHSQQTGDDLTRGEFRSPLQSSQFLADKFGILWGIRQ